MHDLQNCYSPVRSCRIYTLFGLWGPEVLISALKQKLITFSATAESNKLKKYICVFEFKIQHWKEKNGPRAQRGVHLFFSRNKVDSAKICLLCSDSVRTQNLVEDRTRTRDMDFKPEHELIHSSEVTFQSSPQQKLASQGRFD